MLDSVLQRIQQMMPLLTSDGGNHMTQLILESHGIIYDGGEEGEYVLH